MKRMLASIAVSCLALSAAPLTAGVVYDLGSDFSNASNPNGAWAFLQGSTPLSHFAQPGDSNGLNATAENGYWGVGSNFNSAPTVIKVTQDGANTPTYNSGDFLAGDVIAHSTNPGGADLLITWTAPDAGTISYAGSVWYAHSPVTRGNDYALSLNGGSALESGNVNLGENRGNADTFVSAALLNVNVGDVLALLLKPSAGQSFGSLSGLNLTVDFTAVPEPGSALLLLTALTSAAVRANGRRG